MRRTRVALTPRAVSSLVGLVCGGWATVACAASAVDVKPILADLDGTNYAARLSALMYLAGIREKRAVPGFIRALRDDNVQLRVLATRALGEVGDARCVQPLLEAVADSAEAVRTAVQQELPRCAAEATDPRPFEHFLTDPTRRSTMLAAIENMHHRSAIPALIELYGRGDADTRRATVDALSWRADDPRSLRGLARAFRDPDPRVRSIAVRGFATGRNKTSASPEPLVQMLSDSDPTVVRDAAEALLDAPLDSSTRSALVRSGTATNDLSRATAIFLLASSNDPRGFDLLRRESSRFPETFERTSRQYPKSIERAEDEVTLLLVLASGGHKVMAEDFLNCGNDLLAAAARRWAHDRGWTVGPTRDPLPHPRWGNR